MHVESAASSAIRKNLRTMSAFTQRGDTALNKFLRQRPGVPDRIIPFASTQTFRNAVHTVSIPIPAFGVKCRKGVWVSVRRSHCTPASSLSF